MKRRDFVKGLAAAQVAMMAPNMRAAAKEVSSFSSMATTTKHSLAGAPDPAIKRLNVIVHGMFVIVIDKTGTFVDGQPGVYLKAPLVKGSCPHSYQAQAFLPDQSDPDNVLPAWGSDYQMTNPNGTDTVDFKRSADSNLSVVTGEAERLAIYIGQKKLKTAYWTVSLPLPDDLWPLREAPNNYFDGSTYINNVYNATYLNNGMNPGQTPPMIYVLSYSSIASAKITFKGYNYTKDVPIDADGFGRLHFYAESATDCVDYKHTALSNLDDMFDTGLTLQFDPSLPDPDEPLGRDKEIPKTLKDNGVRLAEEESLSERGKYRDSAAFKKGVKLIEYQYRKFFDYKKTLKTKLDRAQVKLVPADLKPPSNCMSLIGTTS